MAQAMQKFKQAGFGFEGMGCLALLLRVLLLGAYLVFTWCSVSSQVRGGLKLNRTRRMRASLTFPTFGQSCAAGFRKFARLWRARPSCFTVVSVQAGALV